MLTFSRLGQLVLRRRLVNRKYLRIQNPFRLNIFSLGSLATFAHAAISKRNRVSIEEAD